MELLNVDFSEYKCKRTETKKKMWLLPMSDSRSTRKYILEFNNDGTAKISEFRNLYPHYSSPRFINEEYKDGGNVIIDNLKSIQEIKLAITKITPYAKFN